MVPSPYFLSVYSHHVYHGLPQLTEGETQPGHLQMITYTNLTPQVFYYPFLLQTMSGGQLPLFKWILALGSIAYNLNNSRTVPPRQLVILGSNMENLTPPFTSLFLFESIFVYICLLFFFWLNNLVSPNPTDSHSIAFGCTLQWFTAKVYLSSLPYCFSKEVSPVQLDDWRTWSQRF